MFASSWHGRSEKQQQQLQRKSPQWIGLLENLQETIDFPIKTGAFLTKPRDNLIESVVPIYWGRIQALRSTLRIQMCFLEGATQNAKLVKSRIKHYF